MVPSQLFVAGIASILCIAIHAVVTVLIASVARRASAKVPLSWQPALLIAAMVTTASALMLAHILEVGVWAETYAVVGAAPADADVLYFAFVNFTTLGYGDVIPESRWRLPGPATAMSGMLLFGWSAALMFEVLRRALGYGTPRTYRDRW
jgi:Ion channel